MAAKIRKEDIIEDGIFDMYVKGIISADKATDEFTKSTIANVEKIEKAISSLTFDTDVAGDIEALQKSEASLIKTQKQLEAQNKKLLKLRE